MKMPMTNETLQEIIRSLEQSGMRPMLCDTEVPYYDAGVHAGDPTEPENSTQGEYILLPRSLAGMKKR